MKKTLFKYNENEHTVTCIIHARGKQFTGVSKCHPEDFDFESKRTGEVISHFRAFIADTSDERETLRDQITALTHVYDALMRNPKVDKRSIESKVLRKQIKILKRNKESLTDEIEHMKAELRYLLKAKNELYVKVRQRRAAENELPTSIET